MEERNQRQIDKREAKLAMDGNSERKENRLNRQIGKRDENLSRIGNVRSEITDLEESKQVYNVTINNNFRNADGDKAAVLFHAGTKQVDIVMPGESGLMNLFAHELKHAHQFEKGTLSMQLYVGRDRGLKLKDWLAYDMQDEIEAYERHSMFGSVPGGWQRKYADRSIPDKNGSPIMFPKGPASMGPHSRSSHATLQEIANNSMQAFRINGKTYIPTK